MEFELKNTQIYRSIKTANFPLFKFARIIKDIFLVLSAVFACLTAFSFLNYTAGYSNFKWLVFCLAVYLLFWNLNLFLETKIKKQEFVLPETADTENLNLAEFLSFDSAKIVKRTIKFCDRKKLPLDSAALFYGLLNWSPEASLIFLRLGLDAQKLKQDFKNYFEKIEKRPGSVPASENFKAVIKEAFLVAQVRKKSAVGEKELLIGLSKQDDFFKKALIGADLKETDIENLTLWFDSAEDSLKKSKKFWSRENLMEFGSLGKDWASGYTITLDQFSIDWRKVVSKWMFREIVGHKKEIEETEMALARSNLSNVLIVGEPGTGRKSIIEALAQRCFLEESLPELNSKRVVELDMVLLSARIQDFEKLETTLDQIFQEVLAAGNVILVIDQLENFVYQSSQKPGAVDISGILSKYLAMPSFKFAGITSYDGLHKNIERNSSFADFFRKVEVSEITEQETIKILQDAALEQEHRNKILILYPAIREIVNLTGRYMPSLPFPKKALDVLDEAVVYAQTLKEKIVMPHHIAELISKRTEIPVGKMEVKEKEVLLNLENLIHKKIINQEEAVKEISIAMRRARAGIASKKRPMGSFLFLGPTGVGKTETAKALAEIYFGKPASAQGSGEAMEKMIRLDMSEFQSVSDIPRLLGAVSPVEMQGLLTTQVRENPFSLVLLDEVEKAYPDILNLLLQVLDEGHVTDGQGRKVVFTNTIIICTSNAAAEIIFKEVQSGRKLDRDKLLDWLFKKEIFKPEFINRFDAVVVYHPLTKENLLQIAQLSLEGLQKSLKEKEISLEITEPLKEKIVELSYKPEFGAREMRRVIQDKIENVVAQALISDTIKKGDKIEIDPLTFEITKLE